MKVTCTLLLVILLFLALSLIVLPSPAWATCADTVHPDGYGLEPCDHGGSTFRDFMEWMFESVMSWFGGGGFYFNY